MAIKPTRVLIVGAGGHGQMVADILKRFQGSDGSITPIGYVDDKRELQSQVVLGLPVLGDLGDIALIPHDRLVIAIGENEVRREVFLKVASREECLQPAVHPRATLAAGVAVGAGTVAAAGVVVNPGSTLGTNCILNTACTIDHHNHLADYVHIAPGAHLGGNVCVGEGSLVGIAAVIRPGCSIGSWTVVGAGAVVVKDLPDRVVAVGVPARIRR